MAKRRCSVCGRTGHDKRRHAGGPKRAGRRGNPCTGGERERAERLARRFHGSKAHVIELRPEERRLSRYVVVAGELPALEYEPQGPSKRGGVTWRHESGDRGPGKPKASRRPLVVVDPVTRRPAIVSRGAPVRFNAVRGFVG